MVTHQGFIHRLDKQFEPPFTALSTLTVLHENTLHLLSSFHLNGYTLGFHFFLGLIIFQNSCFSLTDTTRRARTVASTRGRGRTRRGRGRGRGRGRSSSRGRGRGGRGSSTRTRTSSTTTGRKKKRRKRRKRSKKTTGTTSTKRRKKITKTKTLKRRRVMIAEEDEVSPFIYEPRRRGRTVHARLLESLNSPGPTVEPGRSPSLGRMPFPSRVEPSASFSLFGNTYALHDFVDKEDDTRETSQIEDKTKAWR